MHRRNTTAGDIDVLALGPYFGGELYNRTRDGDLVNSDSDMERFLNTTVPAAIDEMLPK